MPVVLQFSGDQVGTYSSVQDSGGGTSTINVQNLPFLPTDQILAAFTDDSFDANGELIAGGPITLASVQVVRGGVTYDLSVNGNGAVRDSDSSGGKYQGDTFFVTQSTLGAAASGPFASLPSAHYLFVAGATLTGTGPVTLTQESGTNPNGVFDTTNAGNVVCFCSGTLIETPRGPVPVEDLRRDDLVVTADSGALPIRWIGRRHLKREDLRPELRPVRIEAGAFGPGLPQQALSVSAQHKLVMTGWQAELLFGASEVFVAAINMLNDSTVRQILPSTGVTYHHFCFDQHEIVFANGMPAESFFPGNMALDALFTKDQAEIISLFPGLKSAAQDPGLRAARVVLRSFEAQLLAA